MPKDKKEKRKTSGMTTAGRARYNQAMKREARDNIDNPDYVQPSPTEWMAKNYPKGLVMGD